MTAQLTKVGIVIPVYNRREITLQGLRSLSKIDKTGLDVRIFIVDDGSTDGTADAIRAEFPDVELITGDGTLHYAAGTNRGIEAALEWDSDYVAAMNDDAVFHDQFIRRMIAAAEKLPRSIIGALLLLWSAPHRVFQVGQKWNSLKGGWDDPMHLTAFSVPKEVFKVECLVGNCVLIPAAAIRECGLMDEKHFPHGWGDAQYMARFSKMGWNLYVEPRALVWCEPNKYPPALHEFPLARKLKILFADERHPLNLKRQFDARWYSAPSKSAAIAAFIVFCSKLGLKALGIAPKEERPVY